MKAGRIRVAVHAAVLAILIPAAGHAGELQDKLGYCKNCHGDRFQGFTGYFTAPRLAGQPAEYLENQFKALRSHRRDDPVAKRFMWPVVSAGAPWQAIAKHLSALDAPPAADGPRHLVDAGRKIFAEGSPDGNVPACAACHGEDAHGVDQVPRLAGQSYAYVVDQLIGWDKGFRAKDPVAAGGDDNTMLPIAKGLSKEQIKAVAAFVSYQK